MDEVRNLVSLVVMAETVSRLADEGVDVLPLDEEDACGSGVNATPEHLFMLKRANTCTGNFSSMQPPLCVRWRASPPP
jgi:hypothetical protein